LAALICGVVSGPAAYGLAGLLADNHLSEALKEVLGISAIVGILGGALIFAAVTLFRTQTPRERILAGIGVASPIIWAILIFAFVLYALSQV
jgi:hypothetical protein